MTSAHVLDGRCHCGSVSVAFETQTELPAIVPRACDCTFCRKSGAVSVSDPEGILRIGIAHEKVIIRYRFGLGITDFLLCATCGAYVAALSVANASMIGVLNARMLDRFSELAEPSGVSFDGESIEDRRARRVTRWTPVTMQLGHRSPADDAADNIGLLDD